MPFDYAVHSDLLVYWTGGKDIDKRYDRQWHMRNSSNTDFELVKNEVEELRGADPEVYGKLEVPAKDKLEQLEKEYLTRLRSVLKHGLWMTAPPDTPDKPDSEVAIDFGDKDKPIELPKTVARVCFTELKLSQARSHAEQYGRLGIGVKRPFLFDRGGRPVIYIGPKGHRRKRDPILSAFHGILQGPHRNLLHFLKPMHSGKGGSYDFYDESEWRIVYPTEQKEYNQIMSQLAEDGGSSICKCAGAVPPTEDYISRLNAAQQEYARNRLKYLLPLDGWLSCIIYPSVSLKRKALADCEIRRQLRRIKRLPCRANQEGVEKGNWPFEMDLDMCQNL